MKSKGFEKDILAFGYAGEAGVNKIVKDRKEDLKEYFKTSFLDKIITDLHLKCLKLQAKRLSLGLL